MGRRYGHWEVLGKIQLCGKSKKVECRCDCGTVRLVSVSNLYSGKSTSCGCAKPPAVSLSVGAVVGGYTVVANVDWWHVAVSCNLCGSVSTKRRTSVRSSKFGCCNPAKAVGEFTVHHPLWDTYNGMLQRCYNSRAGNYKYYGGRGIVVCDSWLGLDYPRRTKNSKHSMVGFANFARDMGDRPGDGYSVDRIDNDGPYSPDNCRWATQSEQIANSRPARLARSHRL